MSNDAHLDQLKGKLGVLLSEGATDYQNILRLATEIAKQEPNVVRFTTDAAMVRRLGRELVAKQETALAELVKNAYDADASRCTVTLELNENSSSMQIVDDGNGMTRAEIENGFMRLASDAKVREQVSPKFLRSRAGKKGIGRFATERLGRRLTIVTQTESESHGWTINVDWETFTQGEDIILIANSVTRSEKEFPHGTRLSVEGLRDTWSERELQRVYRYLSTLIEPFVDDAESPQPSTELGFAVELSTNGRAVDNSRTVINVDTEVYKHALAIVDAEIDDQGNTTWSLSSNRLNLMVGKQSIGLDRNRSEPLAAARNVKMKAYYFIKARDLLGHSTSFIRDQLEQYGGIRVYRNGYRVPPYGERTDDWLRLDLKRTTTYAPLNSKAFLGYVTLVDPTGALFEETSSREGLIETEAFEEVRNVMSMVLEAAVRRVESARGGKGRSRRKAQDSTVGQRAAAEADAAVTEVAEVINSSSVTDAVDPAERERLQSALSRLNDATRVTNEVARERDDLLKELTLLRILASMGLTIAEFTHDFSHLAETMELTLKSIKRAASASTDELDAALARFEGQFRQVRAYTAHFGNMMTSNASRELQNIELYAFARTFREDMSAIFERRGIDLIVERPIDYDIYTTKMHPSEWSSILLNFLTNAIKATKRAQRPGKFLIRVGTASPESVFLEFSDNGDGIPTENWDDVFDAFFTTTGGSAADASETAQALGTGLGLKIVADIVHAVNGEVRIVDPRPEYATTIRITVPAGSPDQDNENQI